MLPGVTLIYQPEAIHILVLCQAVGQQPVLLGVILVILGMGIVVRLVSYM